MERAMTRKTWTLIVALLLLIGVPVAIFAGRAQSSQETSADKKPVQTLKIDVDLVLVSATVTDSLNRYVSGLESQHFQIWEDKVEQKLEYFSAEDVPISVGVIFDTSGSMKDKIATARNAAATFLKTGNPEDEYFLVEFANRPELTSDFTTDVSKLQNKLLLAPAKGMTAMYDSVYLGLEKLKEGNNPKKALLLITDGEDNRSRYTFQNVKEFVKEQDVQIYGIGIVDEWNSQLSAGHTGRAMVDDAAHLRWCGDTHDADRFLRPAQRLESGFLRNRSRVRRGMALKLYRRIDYLRMRQNVANAPASHRIGL